jgi:hypothetical protein
MLFNCIEDFYEPNDLGLMTISFLNQHFTPSFQSQYNYYSGDRMKAYPCYETSSLTSNGNPLNPFDIFKRTFEKKTQMQILHLKTFLRKTKLSELKKSPSWGQHKQHQDSGCDIAGVVYFNSNSIDDGTNFYNAEHDYEPTAIIGSRYNRCVFYSPRTFHSPVMKQSVEERWVQPFFIITRKETYEKLNENNET